MHPITADQNPISTIFFLLTPCHDDLKSCIQTSTELSKLCTQLTNTANCTLLFLPEYMVQSFIPVLFHYHCFQWYLGYEKDPIHHHTFVSKTCSTQLIIWMGSKKAPFIISNKIALCLCCIRGQALVMVSLLFQGL